MQFNGTIKPRRRGGWIARGVIVEHRFGQIFETQVGPREFADQPSCVAWLADAAKRLGARRPRIATLVASDR
jgi:hypothetical protein